MNNGSRVTGSLSTVLEKYKNLAKDATSSGDYVGAENYMQHAEHYSRMINERNAKNNNNSSSPSNGSSAKVNEIDTVTTTPKFNEGDIVNNETNITEAAASSPAKVRKPNNIKGKESLN